jgi:hypothetical protein
MPAKKNIVTKKPRRSAKTTGKTGASAVKNTSKKKKTDEECDASEQRFVRDLLIRGEAVKPSSDGKLPPGATHKIVEHEDENGDKIVEVERERFSLY